MTVTTTRNGADAAAADATSPEDAPLAALDIGTNSIRMVLVRLDTENGTWDTLSVHKETVRLGQDEFAHNRLSDEAIGRGVLVMKTFAEMARGRGAGEIVAIATAALREAENRDEFIERAREEAGVEVHVVPGIEEARLIYLGVASGIDLGEQKGLFIDIGGGSTELIIGNQSEHLLLESLKLGAIRIGNRFLSGVTGPVSATLYETMRQYARGVAAHAYRKIGGIGFDTVIASSGTAMNLAAVAARRAGQEPATMRNYFLKTSDLAEVAEMLRKMTLEERRKVPGLNPERADIIVSGAAVLQTILEDVKAEGALISDRSLREGVLVDALMRRRARLSSATNAYTASDTGVRRRSIEQLARAIEAERDHARHIVYLTLRLFDQTRALGLHDYGPGERELLEYAALLHDVGVFISHIGHHRHSHYIIRHAELAGFTAEEIEIIANLAYFHRKSPPRKRHEHFLALPRPEQRMVRKLAALLRLAEGLDRSHLGLVQDVKVEVDKKAPSPGKVTLTLFSETDPRLEVWYVGSEQTAFEDAYGLPLEIAVQPIPEELPVSTR